MPSTSQDEGTSENHGSPLHIAKKSRTILSRRGRTIHEDRAPKVPSSRPMDKELVLDLLAFPENVLACILQALPPEQLLNVSRVSRHLAEVSEVALEKVCRAHRWSLPRFPRGAAAKSTRFPWRTLYRQHACIACGRPGDFILRLQIDSHLVHLICRRCTNVQAVQQRMVQENLFVDLVGVSGKKLLSQRDLGRRGTTRGAALLRHYIDSV